MPPKKGTRRRAASKSRSTPPPPVKSALSRRIHAVARFIGVAICSLLLGTILFSLNSPLTQGDLAWTSRHLDSWADAASLLAWRVAEVGVYWILGYDAYDVAWINCHVPLPTYLLLRTFYNIRPTTILAVFITNNLCITIPFALLRSRNTIHTVPAGFRPIAVRDRLTSFYTTLLATSTYTVVMYASYASWIPTFLVTHFDGLADLRAAYEGPKTLVPMFLTFLLPGWAAREFLFVSSVGHPRADERGPAFEERRGELLMSSIYRRTWVPLSMKTKILISRTCVMTAMIMANTVVQILGTVAGADMKGALGWAGIWAGATVIVGSIYGWIEAID